MEESECMVCFSRYDDEEHRPRVMPCGHTLCSKCIGKAIKENSKMCPKCRAHYSISNPKELPVNFSLESLVKSMNISKCTKADILPVSIEHQAPVNQRSSEADKLPECIEYQLPVISRCSTHKSWVCDSCLSEEHSPESCKIITISEELNIKKSRQFDQSKSLLNMFEEACKKSDECKNQCKKLIEENDEEILRYEAMAKKLQEAIQQKKISKKQMENNYAMFDQKIETIKGKKNPYDQAVISLKSSKTIRGVSSCSVRVQTEANKFQLISKEIENEVDQIVKTFKATAESNIEFFIGNHRFSERDGKNHLHVLQRDNTSESPSYNFKFTDEDGSPVTDGIKTFLDLGIPGQESRRIYMKMLGNTARAQQHLLLVTGQCGHSYKGLSFYPPCEPDEPGEVIILQPYDGNKAKSLVKDLKATDVVLHQQTAGLVHAGAWDDNDAWVDNNDNALLGFTLSNDLTIRDSSGFGIVTSGLEILQEIAKLDETELENIKVVDCGVVLV